ncbi:P-loop containing nucleoside triphosphate hydrolase protein [Lipomyces oligophaga]|uniref:P-loop containing nucleoside triphosphate hydrolase protein n=1 Tax=Lipomyces oligophaga TaxID=45792 RepID=UPI0034CDDD0F
MSTIPKSPARATSPQKLTPISHNLPHGRNYSVTSSSGTSKRLHTFTPSQIRDVLKSHNDAASDSDEEFGSSSTEGNSSPALLSLEEENGPAGAGAEFAGKRWVWVPDAKNAFVKGYITLEDDQEMIHVHCVDDSERVVRKYDVEKVNPPKFDKANDMAELTHLNEASVVHNLETRYMADMIYTYSGLFLVAVNPYCSLPIYNAENLSFYRNKTREEVPPHVYAVTDLAFRNMLEMHENQSILVTGESGAGKTENTKKVIQYLAAVTRRSDKTTHAVAPPTHKQQTAAQMKGSFEQQILQANQILEAFGNAQTARNNNSSRFGKFIKIGFRRSGEISGAYIEYYLLEKTRLVKQSRFERNYHIFYQMLSGASAQMREEFLLDGKVSDYAYVKEGNRTIPGICDADEFENLLTAFQVMGFSQQEQKDLLRVIAVVLHIGNLDVGEERSTGQAKLQDYSQAEKLCHTLGVSIDAFVKGLLRPRVKAGRDWVDQSRTQAQVQFSLHGLAKAIYERGFAYLFERINDVLERGGDAGGSAMFIGVLDIAGFEIFQTNSFEQLCINYTNEKLQQFFNHHMFVLEQEEYARENIEWRFIDFGHDLQPTIDLIEKSNPIGIFSCLDEDCVMPRATDKSFTEKLHSLWDKKTDKYKRSLLNQGFQLTHYAAVVDYNTEGWLEKNKDQLNDNISQLLATSSEPHIARLFSEEGDTGVTSEGATRRRRGLFRTVAQRHKEQLTSLMNQLESTRPHFVRCILPNHDKRPKKFDKVLVLDQLRCNGVLEGIRIARSGFPNRLSFAEFRMRYEILMDRKALTKKGGLGSGYVDGQRACKRILESLRVDPSTFRVGNTKVFFRAGLLAELEHHREEVVCSLITGIQAQVRGFLRRRQVNKKLFRAQAVKEIARNVKAFSSVGILGKEEDGGWWRLYAKMQPLLLAQRETVALLARDGEYQKVVNELREAEERCAAMTAAGSKAEARARKVEEELARERLVAEDKDEILRRTQAREADLEEQLSGALEDLEKLESQTEELVEAKKRAEHEVEQWRVELENGARIIGRLEGEKGALEARVGDVEKEVVEAREREKAIADSVEKQRQEMLVVRALLNEREKQVASAEERAKQAAKEMESAAEENWRRVEGGQRQLATAVREATETRSQLESARESLQKVQKLAEVKSREAAALAAELAKATEERTRLEEHKTVAERAAEELRERLERTEAELEGERQRRRANAEHARRQDADARLRSARAVGEVQEAVATAQRALENAMSAMSAMSVLASVDRRDMARKGRGARCEEQDRDESKERTAGVDDDEEIPEEDKVVV